jgi:hypothetical protein
MGLQSPILSINFKNSNVLSNYNVLFGNFEKRGTVLNLVAHFCVCTYLSMRVYTRLYKGTSVHTLVHYVCVHTDVRVPVEVPLQGPARSRR